ncbi:MAG: FctA domain-containing protein, partial [Bacillota bacterium]|nr:FctA domain-containing protein [Bacillota bacterium]
AFFGVLRYTQEDHGKTYTYRIKEVDRAKDGYTYSTDIYDVDVKITDNGDGTLTIEPMYKDAEGNEVKTADFTNTYKAEGDTTLQVWKDLQGRDLEEGEFTFELLDENGDPILNEDGEAVTVTNKKDGTAPFTPEDTDALKFDEKDIGKTFYYGIRESRGDDETVLYDERVFGYAVKVVDNGDGTLYGEQTLVKPVFDEEEPDKIESWTDEGAELPVFTNELKDGGFSIAKTTVDSDDADPDQEFTFKVRLIGNGMDEKTDIDYKTVSAAGDGDGGKSRASAPKTQAGDTAEPKAETAEPKEPSSASTETNTAAGPARAAEKAPVLKAPEGAGSVKAPGDIASGTYDNVDWRITSSGELIIGNGGEQTFANNPLRTGNSYGWNSYRDQITSVSFDGVVRGQNNMEGMFMNCVNATSIDLKGFDTSLVTGMYNMFLNCSKVTSLDVSGMDTSACTIFRTMFNGMSALEEIKGIENFNTSNVTTTRYMFSACSSLKSLDLHKWDTSKVTTMQYMFNGMSALEELNISGFDTSKVTNMTSMFGDTAIAGSGSTAPLGNLKKLDISSFNTSAVTNMTNMFAGLNNMEQIKIGSDFEFKSNAVINDPASDDEYTGKWIHNDGDGNAYTASELGGNPSDLAGTWVWERASCYVVSFSAKGAKGGMDPVMFNPGRDEQLPALAYSKPGEKFSHWAVTDKDGNETGQTYEDGETIPADTYNKDDRVYLKAVFEPIEKNTEMSEGEFEITLKAGEKAVFENIPAGTAYQVYEQTEDGWILVEQNGVSGTVEPLVTSEASFVNKYEPGTTSAQFYGTKTLDYRAAAEDAFEFVLREGSTVIERVKTMDGGFIQFSPIIYKEADIGTHTYTIQEVDPQDNTLDWDAHTETVKVDVTADDEGNLKAAVTYDKDGVKFSNMTRPGNLRLSKVAEGLTPENENDEFTFKITLNNADGMPLGSDESIFWYTVDSDRSGTSGNASKGAVKFTAPKLSRAAAPADTQASAPEEPVKNSLKAPAAAPAKDTLLNLLLTLLQRQEFSGPITP